MSKSIKIDLHGQTTDSAKKLLTQRLKALPDDVLEVEIIHGYHGGTALQEMVRKYKNRRIERKILGLNHGTTTFILKPKEK